MTVHIKDVPYGVNLSLDDTNKPSQPAAVYLLELRFIRRNRATVVDLK